MLLGCAAQAPADPLASSRQTVRVCTGNSCVDQPRGAHGVPAAATDPQAERRLAALVAMAQRDPSAAHDLALRLLRGDGVERDSHQAIEWMRHAGDRGLVQAQSALGRLYLVGLEEMGADFHQAHAWLTRAAAQGDKEALRLLPRAEAGKQDMQAGYQAREDARKSWAAWYVAAPYHWAWTGGRWQLQ